MSIIHWNFLNVLAIAAIVAGGFAATADEKKPANSNPTTAVKKPEGDKPKPATEGDKPKVKPEGDKPKVKPEGDKPKPSTEGVKPGAEKPKKPGEGDKGREGERINGRVEKVDVASNTITLLSKSDKGVSQQVVKIATDAKIGVDGKPGKLSDITTGATIFAFVSSDTKQASAVMISGPRLMGNVNKVEGNTVTLDVKSEKGLPVTSFTVGSETTIFLEGKQGAVADLKPGMMVGVQLSVDGKAAVALKAGREGDGVNKPMKKPEGEKKPEGVKPVKKPEGESKPVKKPESNK